VRHATLAPDRYDLVITPPVAIGRGLIADG
jgi:hypothetical protein